MARIDSAFIDGTIAKVASVTRMAVTAASNTITVNAIGAGTQLVFVDFATMTGKTWSAIASKA
jgi:hypothetical protein